jgi:multiple sugar transport system permease protein
MDTTAESRTVVAASTAVAARRQRGPRRRLSQRRVPYAFLAPTMIALTFGFLLPSIDVIRRSFLAGSIADSGEFVGVGNYQDLLVNPEFWNAMRVSTLYTVGAVGGTLVLGLVTALLLNRGFRGRALVRSAVIIPWALPLVPVALVWRWSVDYEYGVLNALAGQLGGPAHIDWLNSTALALPAVIVIQVWRYFPFAAVMYLAGLQGVAEDLYEAAWVDGAGPVRSFIHVTLPGLRSITTALTLLISIWSFGTAMTIVYLLTHGGPAGATELLSLLAYTKAFDEFDFGAAATVGTVVLLISGAFALVYLKIMGRHDD